MIQMFDYTAKEIELLYSEVENSVHNKEPINIDRISRLIHPGDFYLLGNGANGLHFVFNGLKWVENGEIYYCIIQPQIEMGAITPNWYPIISVNDRTRSSSGNLSMIRKENRYIPESVTDCGWEMRTVDD